MVKEMCCHKLLVNTVSYMTILRNLHFRRDDSDLPRVHNLEEPTPSLENSETFPIQRWKKIRGCKLT